MKLFDLLRLIFSNLNRRKARVALTAIGVVIGTAAVVILVSLAIGLQQNATSQLYGIGDLTQIQVSPGFIEGPAGGQQPPTFIPITDDSLAQFADIPGVQAVIPRDYMMGSAIMRLNRLEGYASIIGVDSPDLAQLGMTAAQGGLELKKGTVIVGAMVAANMYDPRSRPGQEPPPPPDLYDQQIKLILIKWDNEGNEIRKTVSLKVAGVLAESRGESDWSVYLSFDDLEAYNEWVMGRRINRNKDGYNQVIVKVEDASKVLNVADSITALGFQAYTPQSFVQGINNFYMVLQFIFGGVGAIALLVAAIGIANTMTMAILERTREIGLMKAIGATNRDVLSIFLGEAAGIGLIGGLGGVTFGWVAGQIINVLAMVYLANQSAQTGAPPPSVAVSTPLWLPVFTLAFSTFIGLLSGLYPALRAATMVPVTALKYE